ncbi:hypothetical protein JGU71_15175 [Antrihabitans sp. YC3-6]|uniref:LVIVD repeat-containing protein n=1 Tax=Antrihabitans stalagmiti TaxID=2799499 RepID=A0A934U498_9NOCA|nr:hypothetical protein [Antrihabitans stalagmiti]MBJ8340231.1 hypothetical protein [Antrihabitans stalagmiti]
MDGARSRRPIGILALTLGVVLATPGTAVADPVGDFFAVHRTAVARADCGPGSAPEPGLQGEVPLADRDSGRSQTAYSCNMSLIGQYQGEGAGIVSPTYKNCSYTGSNWPTGFLSPHPGVQVIDAADPGNPRMTANLTEPAMDGGTWESLKVNEKRGLLAGTGTGILVGAGYFSVYDISQDCAHPRLLNPGTGSNLTMPIPITTHEGGFSPDGNTYWAAGTVGGLLHAIDIRDPSNPRVIWSGFTGLENHGFGVSPDGNRLYISTLGGITVLDVSAVQRRDPYPNVPHISRRFWIDGQITQHTIPIEKDGRQLLLTVDEAGSGGVKILDATDEQNLQLVNTIKLEINLPPNADRWSQSAAGNSVFGYDAHYCSVDRPVDPTALACGWIQSGIRVFDIRDVNDVKEIAYYNPGGEAGKNGVLVNSLHATVGNLAAPPLIGTIAIARAIVEGQISAGEVLSPRSHLVIADMSADWCMSPPEFHGDQIWVSCMDNGFMALQLDNGVYPLR